MNNSCLIDLISFLRNYYGINHSSLKVNILTHEDVKKLFPFIKRGSTCTRNYEQYYNGQVVLVYDAKNRVIPYTNPFLEEFKEPDTVNNYDDSLKAISLKNIDQLSIDELLFLRRKLRYIKDYTNERTLTKMIHELKREEPHRYRERKMMLLKEIDEDD